LVINYTERMFLTAAVLVATFGVQSAQDELFTWMQRPNLHVLCQCLCHLCASLNTIIVEQVQGNRKFKFG